MRIELPPVLAPLTKSAPEMHLESQLFSPIKRPCPPAGVWRESTRESRTLRCMGGSERLHQTKCWRAEQAWKKFERHPTSRSVREIAWRRHDGEPPTSPHFRCVQQIKLPEGAVPFAHASASRRDIVACAQVPALATTLTRKNNRRAVWLINYLQIEV